MKQKATSHVKSVLFLIPHLRIKKPFSQARRSWETRRNRRTNSQSRNAPDPLRAIEISPAPRSCGEDDYWSNTANRADRSRNDGHLTAEIRARNAYPNANVIYGDRGVPPSLWSISVVSGWRYGSKELLNVFSVVACEAGEAHATPGRDL